jgi:hypothetical protein
MGEKPLFFNDEKAMGDVLSEGRDLVEELKKAKEQRETIAQQTEQDLEKLSEQIRTRRPLDARIAEFKDNLTSMGRKLLNNRETAANHEAELEILESETAALVQQYEEMDGLIDQNIEGITEKKKLLDAQASDLIPRPDQLPPDNPDETAVAAENALQEINLLKDELQQKENALIEEKRAIELQKEEIRDKLEQIRLSMAGETERFVTREDARLYELNFLTRFDTKLNTFPLHITDPIDKRMYSITQWGTHNRHFSEDIPGIAERGDLPKNSGSVYWIEEKKALFGEKIKKVAIEAFSCNNIHAYEEYGFDTQQISLSSLLALLNPRIMKAEQDAYFHVIGIASPTGWERRVIDQLDSDTFTRTYMSRYLTLCLIDSMSGEVYFNRNDARISPFIDFFRLEFDSERLDKIKNDLLGRLKDERYIELEEYCKATNEDRRMVQKSFIDLEHEGYGTARFDSDLGFVFLRR